MRVIKRTGETEEVSFDKVLNRLRVLSQSIKAEPTLNVDVYDIAQKVCSRIYDMVHTSELDELAAQICSSMIVDNPDYGALAARIIISNHHKNTSPSFSETIFQLFNNTDKQGENNPLVTEEIYNIVLKYKEKLNSIIDYSRDYTFDYFGFKTLERSYLMKVDGRVVERPQHMFMRVALGIHGNDIKDAIQTYELMSTKYFTHATPTLFNAGTARPQLSSCFLLSIDGDSISQIFDSIKECALISKHAGGIGIHVHDIRSKGSNIRGTNGTSNGLVPMLKVFNHTARYVDQGGGKRAGSIAVYLEPWHADIMEFLELKKPHGSEEDRARDLFYALWIPDLFMERVRDNGKWSLMCPDTCKGLADTWGEDFKRLYERYEREGKYVKQVDAQQLWFKVLESQIESGTPYLLYKDAANSKSNQKNLGTIKSSNLCTEIIEFSSPDETAVCLTGDTEVITEKGIKYIKDITAEDNIVSFFDDDSKFKENQIYTSSSLIPNGVKDVYEINVVGSRAIKATENHKFLIYAGRNYNKKVNKYVWKTVGELSTKDRIVMPTIAPLPDYVNLNIENDLNTDYLVAGWMIGDGWQRKYDYHANYGVCFGPEERHAMGVVIPHLNKIHKSLDVAHMGHDREVNEYTSKNGVVQWQTSKQSFIKYFKDNFGFEDKLGKNKTISQKIKQSSSKDIASFLSGLFSADGSVYMNNNKFYINLSSASRDILEDTQSLLRCFGIKSRYVFEYIADRDKYQGHLNIYGMDNIKKFQKYINFKLSKDKEQQLIAGIKTSKRSRSSMDRDWVSIRSISYVGKEEVYDISMPRANNFIANGLVTHNCNLSSICLPTFIEYDENNKSVFNFEKLHDVSMVVTKNLNKVIDVNFYPVEKARRSNLRHRPIGIGVQGLADTYALMGYPFDSQDAAQLNRDIFETIYHASVEQSMLISKRRHELIEEFNKTKDENIIEYLKLNEFDPIFDQNYPGAYSTFDGSPAQKGILQFDMWNVSPSSRYDWNKLKKEIQMHGMRNSLLLAPMPTASTSQIMGFNEACEAFTSNIYKRKTLAGEFILVNKYLLKDLIKIGLWNKDMKNKIIINEGSVQDISEIPQNIKDLYKTVWELKQKHIIDQARDRGAFICQSQSMNLFLEEPNFKQLSSMHFYSWQAGLKTGIYYLRSKPKAKQIKFTVDPLMQKQMQEDKQNKAKNVVCTDEVCTVCSA